MKVYDLPEGIEYKPDYMNYDHKVEEQRQEEVTAKTKAWLLQNGFNGPNSGKTVSFGVADGYAIYMLAEGRKSFLIHLPFVDGYHYRDVEFLPKREILRRIKQEEGLKAIFGRK